MLTVQALLLVTGSAGTFKLLTLEDLVKIDAKNEQGMVDPN